MGYVGLSLAIMLAKNNIVLAIDIDKNKVNQINNKISPIDDKDIINSLKLDSLNLVAKEKSLDELKICDFVIIATPTDYDPIKNSFNTEIVESIIKEVSFLNDKCLIVIKSTVPIGFVNRVRKKFNNSNIIFSPEFLREGTALFDNLYPSRIVVGGNCKKSKLFAEMLSNSSKKKSNEIIYASPSEAESIKLFSNTYLAMRVAFFNELDSFALSNNLNTEEIIKGVSSDPRVGNFYNNPSFGYGGYCLPKDTKQMLSNYKDIPQSLISAIVSSNEIRKDYISKNILSKKFSTIGIYRLVMKSNSDNYRDSAIFDIMDKFKSADIEIIVYEPLLGKTDDLDFKLINNLKEFKNKADIIVANRPEDEILDVEHKIFTRNIFNKD